MNEKTPFVNRVRGKLPQMILLLCIIQPVLDVAGYWQQTLGIGNAVTMIVRMLLLGGTVLVGFVLSRRKRYYILTAAVLLVLYAGHIFACLQVNHGYRRPVTDLVNHVRISFLPLMTLCFITFLRENEKVFPTMMKGMVIDILMIAGVQLVSTLTGTDPHTYAADLTGIRGWFLWTNSQSAILAMLAPIAVCWSLRRWKKKLLPVMLIALISEATLFVLAPRLAYASLVITGLGMAGCLLLTDRTRWKQALAMVIVTVLFIAAFPFSPTHERLSANEDRAELTEERINQMDIHIEIVTEPETEPTGDSGEEETAPPKPRVRLDERNAAKLEQLYRSQDIIWSMVERFGRDRVFEVYSYTLDPTVLSNTRLMKIRFCELLMAESGTLSQLFGMNLSEMAYTRLDSEGKPTVDNYDVENDLHGVYFLSGAVGLALMIVFLIYFGIRALVAVIRRTKTCFTLPMAAFSIAYGLGLIHAYYTASVLRRNNASIYLAMVLAGLWYLSGREKRSEQADA